MAEQQSFALDGLFCSPLPLLLFFNCSQIKFLETIPNIYQREKNIKPHYEAPVYMQLPKKYYWTAPTLFLLWLLYDCYHKFIFTSFAC